MKPYDLAVIGKKVEGTVTVHYHSKLACAVGCSVGGRVDALLLVLR
jgi:hypothetical protein